MKKFIFVLLTPVLFFLTVPSTMAEEFVLDYATAFTVRDIVPFNSPDEFDDTDDWSGYWG